jgi:hypothetical protein|tara:strand:+ start:216 stop:476 length:261 start_codon:yes stop_codon:yes gene_type:complete
MKDEFWTKDEQIQKLKKELDFYKKNSVMICGMSSEDDDDGERAKELGVKENETFFDFDEEGFIEDALYQLKCVLKYDKVFRGGEED